MIIKEKILLRVPVLHIEIIGGFVDQRKYRSKTDFINEAIKEKLGKDGVDLTPRGPLKLEDWWE